MMKNLEKEAKNASKDHLKILSDFNIPLHKYNKLNSEEERNKFLLDHMANYIRNLLSLLNDL